MAGQISDQQTGASRSWRNEDIPLRHQRVHLPHQQSTGPLSADIFDRRNEPRGSEAVRPIAGVLAGQLVDAAVACDVIEGGSGFRVQNDPQALG